MKILIISDAWKPQLNGVVRTYEYICAELEKMDHTVKVIGPADFPTRFSIPGYREIELAFMPYRRLKAMIEDFSPEAIHIATEATLGRAALKYCKKHNTPFTTSYHTHFPDYIAKRIGKYLPFAKTFVRNLSISSLKKFHSHSSNMLIATQSLEDELKSWGFKTPMSRLTRGVKLDQFNLEPTDYMKDLKKPIALYVGRVAIEKNLEDFLAMPWNGSKVIIGDGPSLAMLQKKYPQSHFLGKKEGEELANYYRASDIFVFPSKTDTFGIVLIEALASGLPVAGYNVTGPKDIITEPFLGHLDDNLEKASHKALATSGTAEDRHNYVKERYTWEAVADQFMRAMDNSRIARD